MDHGVSDSRCHKFVWVSTEKCQEERALSSRDASLKGLYGAYILDQGLPKGSPGDSNDCSWEWITLMLLFSRDMIWWAEVIVKFLGLKVAGGSRNMGGLTETSAGPQRFLLCTSGSCSRADRGDAPAVSEVSWGLLGLERSFSNTELVLTDLCTNTSCLPHSQLKGTSLQGAWS